MMNKEEMKRWKDCNCILQNAYRDWQFATKNREKDAALNRIQHLLCSEPFMDLCLYYSAQIFGISRYGLDSISERCIGLIDKIAKGEDKYEL